MICSLTHFATFAGRPASSAAPSTGLTTAAVTEATGSKLVGLVLRKWMGLLDLTVAMALPAYVGRLKVVWSSTSTTSESGWQPCSAASLGK